jgi:hypothetical protein
MTQDEIIEMARNSGMELYGLGKDRARFVHYLEAFANLVAKHTLSNIDPSKFMSHQEVMEAARLAEREACAKVCDDMAFDWQKYVTTPSGTIRACASAIRARG